MSTVLVLVSVSVNLSFNDIHNGNINIQGIIYIFLGGALPPGSKPLATSTSPCLSVNSP